MATIGTLIGYIYGCNILLNIHGRDVHVNCPYNKGGVCKHENPAILTSTMYGAYPNDCPLTAESGVTDDDY